MCSTVRARQYMPPPKEAHLDRYGILHQCLIEVRQSVEGRSEVGNLSFAEENHLVKHMENLNARLVYGQQNATTALRQRVQDSKKFL